MPTTSAPMASVMALTTALGWLTLTATRGRWGRGASFTDNRVTVPSLSMRSAKLTPSRSSTTPRHTRPVSGCMMTPTRGTPSMTRAIWTT